MNDIDILVRRLRDGAELLKKGVANPSQAGYMIKAADMLAAFNSAESVDKFFLRQDPDEIILGEDGESKNG